MKTIKRIPRSSAEQLLNKRNSSKLGMRQKRTKLMTNEELRAKIKHFDELASFCRKELIRRNKETNNPYIE